MAELKKINPEDNIKYIVHKIIEKLNKNVRYEFMWIQYPSDKTKIWRIKVEDYPNSITIPNVILEKLSFEQVLAVSDYLVEKIRLWDLNFGKDKVIDVTAEIIDSLPKKRFYDVVREIDDV